MFKKIVVGSILSCQLAYAGGMGEGCTGGNCSNQDRSVWAFGVEGLYIRPAASSVSYLGATNLGNGGNLSRDQYFEQDMGWGFRLDGSWRFMPHTDAKIYWSHLENSSSESTLINYGLIDDGISNDNLNAKGKVNWDDAVFEIGQTNPFAEDISVRYSGGIEYARIDLNRNLYTTNINGSATNFEQFQFDGLGPRVGLDIFYTMMDGFQLYAKGAGSVLLGTSKLVDKQTFSTNPTLPHRTGTRSNSVVPVVSVDVGAQYGYEFDYGTVSIDAGWRLINYIDALVNAGADSNFSIQGPYVGLKWAGDGLF